jgi:hypothetical protein
MSQDSGKKSFLLPFTPSAAYTARSASNSLVSPDDLTLILHSQQGCKVQLLRLLDCILQFDS